MASNPVPASGVQDRSGPTGPRAEAKRQLIVEAALEIVRDRGLAAASVRAVAEQAGLGASTMRYYFPSQSSLNAAVAAELLEAGLADHDIADSRTPAAERLMRCVRQFLPDDGATPEVALQPWLHLVHGALGGGSDSSLTKAVFADLAAESRHRLERWLGILADEGHLEKSAVSFEARALLSRVDGLSLALLAESVDLDQALQILRRDIESALSSTATSDEP